MNEASDQKPGVSKKAFALAIALLAYASIGLQYYYSDFTSLSFFSYFTTLCNLLVAFTLTFSTIAPHTGIGNWSSKLTVQTALVTYISIVSLVYNVALRGIWKLEGLLWLLDNMVHVVVPILYIIYWLAFRTRGSLQWKDGLIWLLFPLFYLIYSLIRGAMINWYPYPFLNAFKFGYGQVSLNILVMLAVFLGAGLIYIRVTRSSKA